jgi:hypothetical protein
MVGKMQLAHANPEPAPEARTLIGTLLRRNLLWVTLLNQKSVYLLGVPERELIHV